MSFAKQNSALTVLCVTVKGEEQNACGVIGIEVELKADIKKAKNT